MLDSFRKLSTTWIGKIVGAFLLVGLAGFGITNVIFDIGTNTVARVGEEDIRAVEFQRAYNNQLQQISQQFGQLLSAEDALAMGIPSAVIGQLAAQAAINQLGERMGLGVSDERLTQMLRQDPYFFGTLGQFDPANFSRVLQQSGLTESEYFDMQRREARREQLVSGLLAGAKAPEAALELVAGYAGDTRTIDYFTINEQSIPPVTEPTEAELEAYLAENQASFRTPETRTVDVLALTPQVLAAAQTITEEEIAAEYERTRDSRTTAERRAILQVPLTTPELQQLFEAGRESGRSFDELVAEAGVTPVELGLLARSQVTDTRLADAAFGLAAGEFAIIPGAGGQRAVAVSEIEAAGETSLEEAREEIRNSLAVARARDGLVDILDQVEELRAAFQPLAEIGARFDLPVHEVELTADGSALSAVPALDEAARARLTSAVFAAEEGRLPPAINLGGNSNAWFDLKQIEPARDQTLDEVRDAVAAAVTSQRTEAALAAEAEQATARLAAGETLADLAAAHNAFPSLSPPLRRDGTLSLSGSTATDPVLDRNVAAAVFAGGPDHVGSARNEAGDHVVFQVVEVTPGSAEQTAAAQQFVEQGTQQALFAQFIGGLRDDAGVRINRQVLEQLIGLDSTVQ